ncbi:hypothetical protein ABIB40_003438 [Pedobacter sp. UYP30]|uniref:hypothetical protein n=1 Tax=Pedobacter sp. UYP30 TaxID=1756400 RepID=UPI00339AF99E
MNNRSILFLVVITLFTACKQAPKDDKNFSITYGTRQDLGEWLSWMTLTLQGAYLKYARSGRGKAKFGANCIIKLKDEDRKQLFSLIDLEKIKKLPERNETKEGFVYGEEWISVSTAQVEKTIIFDYENSPWEIRPLVNKLRRLSDGFKDCK